MSLLPPAVAVAMTAVVFLWNSMVVAAAADQVKETTRMPLRKPIDGLSLVMGSKVKGLFQNKETDLDEKYMGEVIHSETQ
jgi:hypothetical protein